MHKYISNVAPIKKENKMKVFEDIEVNDCFETSNKLITAYDIKCFTSFSGDDNKLYTEALTINPKTGEKSIIVNGLLIELIAFGLISEEIVIYNDTAVALTSKTVKHRKFVFPLDSIFVRLIVEDKISRTDDKEKGKVIFLCCVLDKQTEELIAEIRYSLLVKKRKL